MPSLQFTGYVGLYQKFDLARPIKNALESKPEEQMKSQSLADDHGEFQLYQKGDVERAITNYVKSKPVEELKSLAKDNPEFQDIANKIYKRKKEDIALKCHCSRCGLKRVNEDCDHCGKSPDIKFLTKAEYQMRCTKAWRKAQKDVLGIPTWAEFVGCTPEDLRKAEATCRGELPADKRRLASAHRGTSHATLICISTMFLLFMALAQRWAAENF